MPDLPPFPVEREMRKTAVFMAAVFVLSMTSQAFCKDEAQEERKSSPATTVEEGGAFTPKGKLVIEPGIQYAHYSKNRVYINGYSIFDAILIGQFDVVDIERDVITPYLSARYGLGIAELEVKVPWVYRKDRERVGDSNNRQEIVVSDSDIGDIEAGLHLNLLSEREGRPAVILHAKVKAPTGKDPYGLETKTYANGKVRPSEFPTGSGHWGFSTGLTFVKTTDPAVLFLNLIYYHSKSETEEGFGKMEPGDSYEYGFGMAFALNERFSMSFSFDQRFTEKTEQNGVSIVETDSNVAMFNIGGTYAVSDNMSMGLTIGIGLTEDAPDVTVLLRVPFSI